METNASFPVEDQIDRILMQYRNRNITIGRASEMAGISLREMIAIAAKKGITFQYSLDDLNEDMLAAENLWASEKVFDNKEYQNSLEELLKAGFRMNDEADI